MQPQPDPQPQAPRPRPGGGFGPAAGRPGRRWKAWATAYFFLLPSALVLGVFGLYPLVSAFALSLKAPGTPPGGFVGFANYAAVIRDPDFRSSLTVTLFFVLGTVPVTMVLGYLLAELLHRRIGGRAVYRSLFFMPYIISPVAAAAVWRWIFDTDYGLANYVVTRLGGHAQLWLKEPAGVVQLLGQAAGYRVPDWAAGPSLALVCIILVSVWHALGFAVVVLLAGLAAIPSEVSEAARIDGARGWSLLRRVKLPLLSPTLFFLLVIFTIRAFQTFTQLYVLSVDNRGGPLGVTRNITLYIYLAFRLNTSLGPSYGSAMAFVLFVMILALTLLQFRVLGRRVHYQ